MQTPEDRHAWPPGWFDPERHALLTPATVKAVTHPIRLRLLVLLRGDGPATASGLGARIGHSSGVTSYHLRVLADAGLVAEATELGDRRDRWWRARHEGTAFTFRAPDATGGGGSTDPAEDLERAEQYLRIVAQLAYERVLGYVESLTERADELAHLPWQLADTPLSLTHAEAHDLNERLHALVAPYRRDRAGVGRGPAGPDEVAPDGERRHRAVVQIQLLPDDDAAPDSPGDARP